MCLEGKFASKMADIGKVHLTGCAILFRTSSSPFNLRPTESDVMMLLPLSGLVYHYTGNSSALEKMACAVRYFLRDGVKKKKN